MNFEPVAQQGSRYLIKHENRFFLVDVATKSTTSLASRLDMERLVKHGYWEDVTNQKGFSLAVSLIQKFLNSH